MCCSPKSLSLGYYVEEVHTVERCPHKADVVGPNPTFSNVPIVLVVSTGDCGSPGSGSNPDRHPYLESWSSGYLTCLENRRTFRYREFESRTFRKLRSGCLAAKTAVLHTVHRRFESYSEHNIWTRSSIG